MPTKPKSIESSDASTVVCTPKRLPSSQWIKAAQTACSINPVNNAPLRRLAGVIKGYVPEPLHIALVTTKYWGVGGVKLTVGFMDNPEASLRQRILLHMNAWAKTANVQFVETTGHAQVRIAREGGQSGGYWSYVGTDILGIAAGEPTLNLEAFTMNTPESEYHRVVRHETGHTLGFPHEHMRAELVNKIDVNKAIKYFGDTQGWTPDEVRAQVLTPLEKSSIMGTLHADQDSIMCYQIPGEITKSGKPIRGGLDIDPQDYAFAAKVYPRPATPPNVNKSPFQQRSCISDQDAAVVELRNSELELIVKVKSTAGALPPADQKTFSMLGASKDAVDVRSEAFRIVSDYSNIPTSDLDGDTILGLGGAGLTEDGLPGLILRLNRFIRHSGGIDGLKSDDVSLETTMDDLVASVQKAIQ